MEIPKTDQRPHFQRAAVITMLASITYSLIKLEANLRIEKDAPLPQRAGFSPLRQEEAATTLAEILDEQFGFWESQLQNAPPGLLDEFREFRALFRVTLDHCQPGGASHGAPQ